jgi:hypothetical protein
VPVPEPRFFAWEIDETSGFDTAWAEIRGRRLIAEGRTAGQLPFPYWTEYTLETGDDFVTARVIVEARWADGRASLDLRRDVEGGWTVDGGPRPDLATAFDCDLAGCPLTNTMPVLRHDLLRTPGDHHFLMAFIEVPGLRVVPSKQRYTQIRSGDPTGAVIKYRSGSFESDLVFDADGFVLDYPQLGRRVLPRTAETGFRERGPGSARPGPADPEPVV